MVTVHKTTHRIVKSDEHNLVAVGSSWSSVCSSTTHLTASIRETSRARVIRAVVTVEPPDAASVKALAFPLVNDQSVTAAIGTHLPRAAGGRRVAPKGFVGRLVAPRSTLGQRQPLCYRWK